MAKEISVKIIDEQKLKFEILQDSKAGDYFILNNDKNTEIAQMLTRFLETNKSKIIQTKIQTAKEEWERNELVEKIAIKKAEIEKKHIEREKDLQSNFYNKLRDIEKNQYDEANNFKSTIEELKLKIRDLENEKANIKIVIEAENARKNQEEIQKLFKQKIELETKLIEQNNNFLRQKQNLEENVALKADKALQEENYKLKENIEKLKRSRGINSKVMGENLENWIKTEFDNSMGLLGDVTLEKINKTIEGTKADFLFTVFDEETIGNQKTILSQVIIEAKTQGETGKTKNASHFTTLDINRKKNHSEYALLITELEQENEFLIQKINEYNDMFMIRPAYFITFLSLIRLLALKRKSIIKDETLFKDKKLIIQELEDLKNDILGDNKIIAIIETHVLKLQKSNSEIQKHVNKIDDSISVILRTHLATLKNKIANFEIKTRKINKKITDIVQKEKQ